MRQVNRSLMQRGQIAGMLGVAAPLFVLLFALIIEVGVAGYYFLVLQRTIDAAAYAAGMQLEREKLLARCERRWVSLYERSLRRYGRGLTPVRGRVCQGCFVQLPTSAAPPPGEAQLHVCESCGRLLLWRQPPVPAAAGA